MCETDKVPEALQEDLTDINKVLEVLKERMGERYAEKFEERGSFRDEDIDKVMENLGRNLVQFINVINDGNIGLIACGTGLNSNVTIMPRLIASVV